MISTKTVTLGISPGMRHLGIARLEGNKLMDSRIRTVFGRNDVRKVNGIISRIDRIVLKHGVTSLSVKIPPPERTTELTKHFIAGLQLIGEKYGIPLHTFTLDSLCSLCTIGESKPINRAALAVSVLYKFPDLLPEYARACSKKKKHYYLMLFEAIACAICAPKP